MILRYFCTLFGAISTSVMVYKVSPISLSPKYHKHLNKIIHLFTHYFIAVLQCFALQAVVDAQ